MSPLAASEYAPRCDNEECENGAEDYYTWGETEDECAFRARRLGWEEVAPGVWHCPACVAIAKGEPKPIPHWANGDPNWETRPWIVERQESVRGDE